MVTETVSDKWFQMASVTSIFIGDLTYIDEQQDNKRNATCFPVYFPHLEYMYIIKSKSCLIDNFNSEKKKIEQVIHRSELSCLEANKLYLYECSCLKLVPSAYVFYMKC